MKPRVRGLVLLGVLSLFSVLLSGCFLRALSGAVIPDGEAAIVQFEATSITADCDQSPFSDEEGFVRCFYDIEFDLSFEIETTTTLISKFGLFGVLIDPVILQVPEDASDPSGTFTDTSSSTTLPLVITETDSFKVQPGVSVAAEPGRKFFILEFPAFTDADEVEYDFDFTFHVPEVAPVDVKAMFAGRVDPFPLTYYIPLLPCTTDFADVPEFTIPVADSPQDLMPALIDYAMNNDDIGCDGQVYDFRYDALWGDDDCSLAVAIRDPLKKLLELASIPYDVFGPDCPALGDSVSVQPAGFVQRPWGDTNCDGEHDTDDALQILRHIAGLPVNQEPSCPEIGAPVFLQPEAADVR